MKKIISLKKMMVSLLAAIILLATPLTSLAATPTDTAVSWAVSIAGNAKYGYDQTNRWEPNYDCSSFLITAWQNAGVPVKTNGAGNTSTMNSAFLKSGFTNVTSSITLSSGKGLQKGDILLKPGSHTAMVTSVSGSSITIVHASKNEKGTVTGGQTGDQNGKEILTRSYYNHPWTIVLRYKTAATSTPTPATAYYPKYTGTSASLVDGLNAVKVDSSYANRAKIAKANGITNYSGTAAQNTQLLTLLKKGTLKKA